MTLPLSSITEFIGKTMIQTKTALKARLQRYGWVIREGVPDLRSLPKDPARIQAWVFVSNLRDGAEGAAPNWQTEAFAARWDITLVHELHANTDPSDTPMDDIIIASSRVLESLVATIGDVTLDSSINDSNDLSVDYGVARVAHDRNVLTAVISLRANHPLGPCRSIPGA